MMYFNRRAVTVTVDDRFLVDNSKRHAFVRLITSEDRQRQIWPLLVEKAYAKIHGNYQNIEGGSPATALEHLTNGIPSTIDLRSQEVGDQFNTGELWSKLQFYV